MNPRRRAGGEATAAAPPPQPAAPDAVVIPAACPAADGTPAVTHVIDFDHDAIESVLKRAAELGGATGVTVTALDPATLVEIAAQVGIPAGAVAAALAEQRAGVDRDLSLLDRLVGPDEVWAERVSSQAAEVSVERAAGWLERAHGLRPRTTADGMVIARKRDGVAGRVHRSMRTVTGGGELGKLREVRAVAVEVDLTDHGLGIRTTGPRSARPESTDLESARLESESTGAVVLLADLSDKRTGAVVGGAAVTAAGSVVLLVIAAFTTPLVLVALPAAAAAGIGTSRWSFGSTVRRVQYAVDEIVDDIAAGRDAPSLLAELAGPLTGKLRRKR